MKFIIYFALESVRYNFIQFIYKNMRGFILNGVIESPQTKHNSYTVEAGQLATVPASTRYNLNRPIDNKYTSYLRSRSG